MEGVDLLAEIVVFHGVGDSGELTGRLQQFVSQLPQFGIPYQRQLGHDGGAEVGVDRRPALGRGLGQGRDRGAEGVDRARLVGGAAAMAPEAAEDHEDQAEHDGDGDENDHESDDDWCQARQC